jgi:hypothetical protein
MGVHHLVSVDGDQLWQQVSDREQLFRALGAAVVQACDDETDQTIAFEASASGVGVDPRITVKYIGDYSHENFELLVWVDGNTICLNQMPDVDHELLSRLASLISEIRCMAGPVRPH